MTLHIGIVACSAEGAALCYRTICLEGAQRIGAHAHPDIAEIVAAEAVERGYKPVGLTGTRWLVESDVYPRKLTAQNVECVLPTAAERAETNRIIMDELVYSVFKPDGIAYFQRVFARMNDAGFDAVILGCTEIPLIMNDSNSPLPTLDSTRLLARAAVLRSISSN